MIRAILLDLDDTLYDEADYVRSGFRVVAREIAAISAGDEQSIHHYMLDALAHHGRGRIFDATLAAFGVNVTPQLIKDLVELYRQHLPAIGLYSDADRVLHALRADYRLAIVTDGLPLMQKQKIEALGLRTRVDAIVYCWEHAAPKPALQGFQQALENLGVTAEEALVVGDRPDHDLAAAAALGCPAVRLRRGRYADRDSAPYEVVGDMLDLQSLPGLIRDLSR